MPTEELVDQLFVEIDRYVTAKEVAVDASAAAEGSEWLARIEAENAHDLTPERLAAMEAEQAALEDQAPLVDEESSPTAGRRFSRSG